MNCDESEIPFQIPTVVILLQFGIVIFKFFFLLLCQMNFVSLVHKTYFVMWRKVEFGNVYKILSDIQQLKQIYNENSVHLFSQVQTISFIILCSCMNWTRVTVLNKLAKFWKRLKVKYLKIKDQLVKTNVELLFFFVVVKIVNAINKSLCCFELYVVILFFCVCVTYIWLIFVSAKYTQLYVVS